MKSLQLVTAAVLGLATAQSASATDLGIPIKALAASPGYNWSGFYIGGNFGSGWENSNFTSHLSNGAPDFAGSYDSSGLFGGGQIGFNYVATPRVLIGVEADGDWSNFSGSSAGCISTGCASGHTTLDAFGTVRGRVGYVWNNWLLYGTGGWAWSDSGTNQTVTCSDATCAAGGPGIMSPLVGMVASSSGTQSGWAAGAGVEWGFLPHWSLRLQYLHLEFDGVGREFRYAGFPTAFRNVQSNDSIDTVSIGVNYLFNWGTARPAIAHMLDWSQSQLNASGQQPTQDAGAMTSILESNAGPNFIAAWQATAAQVRANQPAWSSPLVTTTGMLEQRFRFDIDDQQAGNGTNTAVLDGGKGVDLIVSNSNEIQIAPPPYDFRGSPTGNGALSGLGDWAFVRVKQQLASSPASGGNYFVTVWLQVQAPTGIPQLTSAAWSFLPTFAFGKGWGDFDIQATVGGVLPASNVATLGDQIQTNVAFQYHLMKVFWPELEVNWIYYVDGQRGGLNQIFLTPGLVLGRFQMAEGILFTTGLGYQIAVAPNYRPSPQTPAYSNAWVFTSRFNF